MEILRLSSSEPQAVIEVSEANTEYQYTILDLSDSSTISGTVTSDGDSEVTVSFSKHYDSEYRITVDGEEHFFTVVRPYVNPATLGSTTEQIEKFTKHEEIVRAVIDSVIPEGFYYKKRVVETIGLGADYLPLWIDAKKLNRLYENNVLLFDSENIIPENLQYGISDDKTAITIFYEGQINRLEGAALQLPQSVSDIWDMNFGYRGFPKGFNYTLYLEVGYNKVPSDIRKASLLLIDDLDCGKLEYIERYVQDYQTDQYKIKFDSRVFEGTGNMIADKILSKYAKSVRHIGVL